MLIRRSFSRAATVGRPRFRAAALVLAAALGAASGAADAGWDEVDRAISTLRQAADAAQGVADSARGVPPPAGAPAGSFAAPNGITFTPVSPPPSRRTGAGPWTASPFGAPPVSREIATLRETCPPDGPICACVHASFVDARNAGDTRPTQDLIGEYYPACANRLQRESAAAWRRSQGLPP